MGKFGGNLQGIWPSLPDSWQNWGKIFLRLAEDGWQSLKSHSALGNKYQGSCRTSYVILPRCASYLCMLYCPAVHHICVCYTARCASYLCMLYCPLCIISVYVILPAVHHICVCYTAPLCIISVYVILPRCISYLRVLYVISCYIMSAYNTQIS